VVCGKAPQSSSNECKLERRQQEIGNIKYRAKYRKPREPPNTRNTRKGGKCSVGALSVVVLAKADARG
jgi:hypothetical protein